MTRNLLLLTTTVGALSLAGAALSQTLPTKPSGAMNPQTPMASSQTRWAAGTEVMASDGATLGVLDTATVAGEGMLRIRAADGTVKMAPSTGASMMDGHVMVAWSKAEFDAAPTAPQPDGAMTPQRPAMPPVTPPVESPSPTSPQPVTPPTSPN